ncbi:hypothetical protein ACHQM5_006390 [Ranunculus cassubicifolius]
MVPEWQEAYMDYNYLKSLLKEIQLLNQTKKTISAPRTFTGLTRRNTITNNMNNEGGDIEDQVTLVNMVNPNGSEELYETMFLMLNEEGGQKERGFFRKLDEEFNKVNKFYRIQVDKVVEEATFLAKQMAALIAFRIKVESYDRSVDFAGEMNRLASGVAASAAAVIASIPSGSRSSVATLPFPFHSFPFFSLLFHSIPFLNLNFSKHTLKSILQIDRDKGLKFRRENIKRIEDQLKQAFIQFYQKLRLLKNYSFLNLLAVSKIMKKYDKTSSRNASKSYLNMVDNSYIGSSDEVTRLVEKVEDTLVTHFSKSNRWKGMNILRPKAKKETHTTTFNLGLFTGCALALLVALVWIFNVWNIMEREGFKLYMENMFPLYSLFGFIVLHMVMYAGKIYYWRRYGVNYLFIFGFKQGTELGYREVLLSSGLASLALASVLANLDMEINKETKDYKALTELIPLALVVLVFLITFCPFNILYRSSCFFLLCCVFRCICAPLYKVTLPDFFLADQLTSQIQALRDLEFYICYYGWGDFKQRRHTCTSSNVYNTFYFIVATIPYWLRLLQCLRRLYEEKDPMQGYNGLKYFSTIVAVLIRTAYSRKRGQVWWILAFITSSIATVFGTYWDLVCDWGLLQRHSQNPWLRDKLILPCKSVYFGVMVLNVVLRFAWLQTILDFQVSFLRSQTLIAIMASLEIIRCGIWNFFRLENEHLNNVGKYRAFKSVPLPFNYDEKEESGE